jgi:hypothetical protein
MLVFSAKVFAIALVCPDYFGVPQLAVKLKFEQMSYKFFLSFLLLCFFVNCQSQISLIGNWRRTDLKLTPSKNNKQWGDTEFKTDSTFHIEGDTTNEQSTTPGWHVGGAVDGIWKFQKPNYLSLHTDPNEPLFFFRYRIMKLTKNELVLSTYSDKKSKKSHLRYRRLLKPKN